MFIERDKNGFITDNQRKELFASLPIVVRESDGDWELITKDNWLDWLSELEKDKYTHWGICLIQD